MHLIPRLIGIVPFGIGVTVLGFLWLTPFNQFGSPPLFFRIFGSFIALGFVLVGVTFFKAGGMVNRNRLRDLAETMRDLQQSQSSDGSDSPPNGNAAKTGYDCPNCGASLGDGAEVSPSGDVKCDYCKRWFNIHSS